MSLSSTIPRNVYVGNGSVTTYAWTWMLNQASDLRVVVISNATPAVLTVLALTTDYTIQTPATQLGNSAGGNIVLTGTGFLAGTSGQLPTGWTIVIRRAVVFQQNMSLRNQGEFQPASIESGLDALCMEIQELQDIQARCIQVPTDDAAPTQSIGLATARAGLVMAFDSSGNPEAIPGPVGTPVSAYIAAQLLQAANIQTAQYALGIDTQAGGATLTSNVYDLSYVVFQLALSAGNIVVFVPGTTNGGAASLKIGAAGVLNTSAIYTKGDVALSGGELVGGSVYLLVRNTLNTHWLLLA